MYSEITCIFFVAVLLATVIPESISQAKEYFINVSGLASNIILIFGGLISVKSYRLLIKILNRIIPCAHLRQLGYTPQMWAFITVCIFYFFIGLCNEGTESISYLTISIILGRFFWIDNNKNDIKRLFLSFFELPHNLCIFYILSNYICCVCIYTNIILGNINYTKFAYSIVLSGIMYYIYLMVKYRNEIWG